MLPTRAPLISAGQIYLNSALNEYMIVTKNVRGQVHYAGLGFVGQVEDESFLKIFEPVDPADVLDAELASLLKFCAPGTKASVGFIREDE